MPAKGIGLARMEFMVMNHIKVHPLALLQPDVLTKEEAITVNTLTAGYKDNREYFINKLAEGVGTMCAAFHPHDVILRFSDFKSNEYANLIGGTHFEPKEDNPMLGWRGASRYYDPKYKPGFALECEAVKKVQRRRRRKRKKKRKKKRKNNRKKKRKKNRKKNRSYEVLTYNGQYQRTMG